MSDLRKAAEMALDYIRREGWTSPQGKEVWLALRQALSQPEQYDQTALELCEKCGWKAIIPDEGCLICTTPVSIEKQEPVGYVTDSGASAYFCKGVDLDDGTPLYAAPPHYWGNVASAELVEEIREELRRRDMLMVPVKEQEPVAVGSLSVRYFRGDKAMTDTDFEYLGELPEGDYTLYTAPPKREWVDLTEEEIRSFDFVKIQYGCEHECWVDPKSLMKFAKNILQAAKEKNA